MLLIDNDCAQISEGQQNRRSGAYQDNRLTVADLQPGCQALTVVEGRVPYDNSAAEVVLESSNRLRGKIDLRNQHQGLVPGVEVFL